MTSHTQALGWARMQALLSTCEWRVWELLAKRPGLTRNEIDSALKAPGIVNANYSRRLAKMRRMGVLVHGPERECSVSGNLCDTWSAVEKDPVKVKEPSRKSLMRSKVQEIEEALAGPGGLMPDPRIDRLRQLVKEAKEISQ